MQDEQEMIIPFWGEVCASVTQLVKIAVDQNVLLVVGLSSGM